MNIRHQAFADEYLSNGMNASKAYTKIYQSKESVSETNGSKLLRNTQVLAYIQTKKKLTSDNLGITVLRQLQELEKIRDLSMKALSYKDALKALEMQNKMLGLEAPTKMDIKTNITTTKHIIDELLED